MHNGSDWTRAWHYYDLRWTRGKRPYLTIPDQRMAEFAEEAAKTTEVFELAKRFVGSRLKAGKPIPLPFRKLFGDYLLGEWTPRQRKVGRPTNWGRDFIIIEVMTRLETDYGVELTRNTSPPKDVTRMRTGRRTEAASELLFEALNMPGIEETGFQKIGLKRIQNIWSDENARTEHLRAKGLRHVSIFDDAGDSRN